MRRLLLLARMNTSVLYSVDIAIISYMMEKPFPRVREGCVFRIVVSAWILCRRWFSLPDLSSGGKIAYNIFGEFVRVVIIFPRRCGMEGSCLCIRIASYLLQSFRGTFIWWRCC